MICLLRLVGALALAAHSCNAFILGPKQIRHFLTSHWYKGPVIVIDIIGADLEVRAIKDLERWGKPDTLVKVHHGRRSFKTEIESSSYYPRYHGQGKLPYCPKSAVCFTLYEVDIMGFNQVVGRACVSKAQVLAASTTKKNLVLSLGDGVGTLKVQIWGPLPFRWPQKLIAKDEPLERMIKTTWDGAATDKLVHSDGLGPKKIKM
mmetsp:Transcript_95504/g.179719  ORF Transcript_95504/g.179719 Transcript_95504/m.179719 type:complete len:205 (+) Transcript_95504:1-615(+)